MAEGRPDNVIDRGTQLVQADRLLLVGRKVFREMPQPVSGKLVADRSYNVYAEPSCTLESF
jgi:hypothetical protein